MILKKPFLESRLNATDYYSQLMTTKLELIETQAIKLLKNAPQGLRTSQLISAIQDNLPDVHPKTINGTVWKLPTTRPEEVYKPSRGLFRHVSFRETQLEP
jgi:hypothetical protein